MKNKKYLILTIVFLYLVLLIPVSHAATILQAVPCSGECITDSKCKKVVDGFDPQKTICDVTLGEVCCGEVVAATSIPVSCFDSFASTNYSCKDTCDRTTENTLSGNFNDCNKKCCQKKTATRTPADTTVPPAGTTNANCPAGTVCFDNPVGATTLIGLVGNIMNGLRSVIVVVAIVFIVIGGIMYMSSAGSEKMIDKAKAIISGALIGLAITLAAPTFLKEIIKILGNPVGDPNAVIDQALTIYQIAVRTLNFLLSVAGVLAIIGLVVGGVFYFTSYGDEERIEKGKKIISASLIGIAITLAAVLIVKQIMNLMGMA